MVKECSGKYDGELIKVSQNHGLTWLPWVGQEYGRAADRVLVVAESHYSNEELPERIAKGLAEIAGNVELTREVVEESCIRLDWTNTMVSGLYRALFRTTRLPEGGRINLWKNIAFYNFIQRPMEYHGKVKERPAWDEFFRDWNTFVEIVKVLRPTQVIFVGTSAMGCFKEALSAMNIAHDVISTDYRNGAYSRTGWLEIEGNHTGLVSIRHTSSFFSWSIWNAHLTKQIPTVMKYLDSIVFADSLCERVSDVAEAPQVPHIEGLPEHLKHQPIIACDFQEVNKTVSNPDYDDARFISIGRAQYDHDDISVKILRRGAKRWSRQSEEVPIQRLPYMMEMMLAAIYRLQNPEKQSFMSEELNEIVVHPEDLGIMSECFASYGELIRKGLMGVKDLIERIDIDRI